MHKCDDMRGSFVRLFMNFKFSLFFICVSESVVCAERLRQRVLPILSLCRSAGFLIIVFFHAVFDPIFRRHCSVSIRGGASACVVRPSVRLSIYGPSVSPLASSLFASSHAGHELIQLVHADAVLALGVAQVEVGALPAELRAMGAPGRGRPTLLLLLLLLLVLLVVVAW